MKIIHVWRQSTLIAALFASALVSAQTALPNGMWDSTGIVPSKTEGKNLTGIDRATGSSGATLILPRVGYCPNFFNPSPTVAVSVAMECGGNEHVHCYGYLNGTLITDMMKDDRFSISMSQIIVPPLSSFSSSFSSPNGTQVYQWCSITALANNVTAQSIGLRFVTFEGWEWTSGPTTTWCNTLGSIDTGLARYVRRYNYGQDEIGPIQTRTIDNSCNNNLNTSNN
jgi:hypothetical protein